MTIEQTAIYRVNNQEAVTAIRAILDEGTMEGSFVVFDGFRASMNAEALDFLIAREVRIVRDFINDISGTVDIHQAADAIGVLKICLKLVTDNGGTYQYFPEAGYVLSDLPGHPDG